MQAKDELDRLVQLEYWLKFDFTGCVRKLLPPLQQVRPLPSPQAAACAPLLVLRCLCSLPSRLHIFQGLGG